MLIVLAIALGLGAWMLMSAPAHPTEGGTTVRDTAPTGPAGPLSGAGPAEQVVPTGPRAIGGLDLSEAPEYTQYGRVFDGTGTIVAEIRTEAGTLYPDTWTLTLEPSHVAEGADRAITRIVQSELGQRNHEFRNLPMAAYRLRVEAPGLASMIQEVALFKVEGHPHLRGVDHVSATLTLNKIAFVDGAVRTSNGDVAEDLPVFLVDRRNKGGIPLGARTDIAGQFRFDAVKGGTWLLYVGDAVRPIVPPIPVNVSGQPMRVDDVTLPPLATLNMIVVDEYGRPFPDVDLTGYLRGTGSGSFRIKSDALGRATLRYLAPGPWRVDAKYEDEGQSGKADLALTASDGTSTVHEIHIK